MKIDPKCLCAVVLTLDAVFLTIQAIELARAYGSVALAVIQLAALASSLMVLWGWGKSANACSFPAAGAAFGKLLLIAVVALLLRAACDVLAYHGSFMYLSMLLQIGFQMLIWCGLCTPWRYQARG